MTCAEARRQLPAPEAAHAAAVAAHLGDCIPCRAESDALKEVDRRLHRLGQVRVLKAQPALPGLTQSAQAQLGLPLAAPAARPRRRLLWIAFVCLAAAALLGWRLH